MQPLPTMSHFFSLTLQEEKQREVGVMQNASKTSLGNQVAFAVQPSQSKNTNKKDRPIML